MIVGDGDGSTDDNRGLNIETGVEKVKEVIKTVSGVGGTEPTEPTTNTFTTEQTLSPPESGNPQSAFQHNGGVENSWSEVDVFKPDQNPAEPVVMPSKICNSCSCEQYEHDDSFEKNEL